MRVGDVEVLLDSGQVLIQVWANKVELMRNLARLYRSPVVTRYVGGTLFDDLSLKDNLALEAALLGQPVPADLMTELGELFARSGCPVDLSHMGRLMPERAGQLAQLQVKIGRAMLVDPDVLVVNAADWDDELLCMSAFSLGFTRQYPWRTLIWAVTDETSAATLRRRLSNQSQAADANGWMS